MMQVAVQSPNYEAMSKADLIEIIENQKAIIQQFYRLLPVENKKLAPGEKLAWIAAKPLIEKEKPNEQGLVRIPIDKIAERIGMSASSASRYIDNICRRFDATHTVEPYITQKGQRCNLSYIDPDDPLWTSSPDELPLPPEKERTINRNECPHCKSSGTIKVKKRPLTYQEIIKCELCGYQRVSEILKEDNEPLEPGEYIDKTPSFAEAFAEKGPQPEEPFESELEHMGLKPEDLLTDMTEEIAEYKKGPQPEDLFSAEPQNLQDSSVYTGPPTESPTTATPPVSTHAFASDPPAELQVLPIWCPWRYEQKPGEKKMSKVPYNPQEVLCKAKVDDATTWGTYEQATAYYLKSQAWYKPFDGIGFMCSGEFTGVDLDHCRNKETGEISESAQALIDRFASYVYITPSGEGVRIIIVAKKPGTRCKWPGGIEIYDHERFFTWTPDHLAGTPETIEKRQAELDELYKELVPENPPDVGCIRHFTCSRSDDGILEKARNARNGAKFSALFDGSTAGYLSHSEADNALCELLLYWTDDNEDVADRLFRQSGLMSEKWEREDYRASTFVSARRLANRRRSA